MPDPRGFLKYQRHEPEKEAVATRLTHHREFERALPVLQAREQATRCMGCGVPFCHTGCPLGNAIPDFNDLVREDRWPEAIIALEATNNFPEITGRICPAPCEAACVLGKNDAPVSIKALERAIAEHAMTTLLDAPPRRATPTGKRVAVIGSGPAGLACADQLARVGHQVTVLERDDRVGGLLRYGIPDFKMEKGVLDLRIERMRRDGVTFRTGVTVGAHVSLDDLRADHDAVVIATGATVARDLPVPGRELAGVCFAMDYLTAENRVVAGDHVHAAIDAKDARVVILGGGDTGSDCLGTALRQGARSVHQIELLPRPPASRSAATPWPLWPHVFRTSTSQEEGGVREFAVMTKRILGNDAGRVRALELVRVEVDGRNVRELEGTTFTIEADLVLLAMGFVGADPATWGDAALSMTSAFGTNLPNVFACGDARRGQSLVVWAIWEGREAARVVDLSLSRETSLPTTPYAYAP